MRIKFTLGLMMLALAGLAACQQARSAAPPLRILFVGNSYTSVNDLPAAVGSLFKAGGQGYESECDCGGGANLQTHWESKRPQQLLGHSHYDWMVLQEQSQIPSFEEVRGQRMYPAARLLCNEALRNGTRALFFLTPARQNGDPENVPHDSFTAMQRRLQEGYEGIAREQRALVAPVGLAWQRAWQQKPDLGLWQADGSHPTLLGTYLSACVFYDVLSHGHALDNEYIGHLSGSDAHFLQQVADKTVGAYPQSVP